MDIHELIALLRDPGDTEIPGTIYDDLTTAHNDAVGGAQAKVLELETALAESASEVPRLKALNYDLLMSAPSDADDESDDVLPDGGNSAPSIESLFQTKD